MPYWRDTELEWDGGNIDHLDQRHRVSPHEVEEAFFYDPLILREGDFYRVLGQTDAGRYLSILCEWRGHRLRAFSARNMISAERRRYDRR